MESELRALRDVLLASPAKRFLLKEPIFVIVGTGRSGTGYISRVLTQSGIRTGHESWWNPHGIQSAMRLVGDASWCAAFDLDGYEGHVFHQVRDPLAVVSSLATTELGPSWQTNRNRPFYELRQRHAELIGDPTVDAMAVVVSWIRESERRSEWSYRVEDVREATIMELAERVNLRVDRAKVRAALQSVSTATNRRRHGLMGWNDLPDGMLKSELLEIATRYGYR